MEGESPTLIAFLIKINNKKLDLIITSTINVKQIFHLQYFCHILFCACGTFLNILLTCVNCKLLIIIQQIDVYLNESIKIDKQIKLANELIQRRTRDRNGTDNKLVVRSIEIKKEEKNVMF